LLERQVNQFAGAEQPSPVLARQQLDQMVLAACHGASVGESPPGNCLAPYEAIYVR
jgi:hypothetical protein